MQLIYRKAGWIYVISHSTWGQDVYKIGESKNLDMRLKSYNASHLVPVQVHRTYFCKNRHVAEDHLKRFIMDHVIQSKTEWIRMKLETLLQICDSLFVKDLALTEAYKESIYTLFPHKCTLYSTQFLLQKEEIPCKKGNESNCQVDKKEETGPQWFRRRLPFYPTPEVVALSAQLRNPKESKLKNAGIYWDSVKNSIRVDFTRNHKRFQRCFSVSKWGTQAEDLAQQWKKQIEAEVVREPPKKKEIPSGGKFRGVYFDARRNCWTGCVQFGPTRVKKEFSLVQYSSVAAFNKAKDWRISMTNTIISNKKSSQ